MVNSDTTRNDRKTYSLWRDVGDRYVMADLAVPDDAAGPELK